MEQTVMLKPTLPRGPTWWPWRRKFPAIRVTFEVDEEGVALVVGDALDEVLRPFDEHAGYAVLGAWEEGFACQVDGMSAAEYLGLGSKSVPLTAFRERFRAWVHEEARSRLFQGVPAAVSEVYAKQGRSPPAPRVVTTDKRLR